ncbi:hypothetical protein RCL_jg8296.t1 [Rhizophagus clarus]|uniref:Uncharacterized protein n=1 Tax=Rhizophagus clarus TaxID=94130 RepID=A0A8H3MHU5_9GLOM|nr:hypothetical protein RCL_jg8296.t1 [Rhizophagus clarus]
MHKVHSRECILAKLLLEYLFSYQENTFSSSPKKQLTKLIYFEISALFNSIFWTLWIAFILWTLFLVTGFHDFCSNNSFYFGDKFLNMEHIFIHNFLKLLDMEFGKSGNIMNCCTDLQDIRHMGYKKMMTLVLKLCKYQDSFGIRILETLKCFSGSRYWSTKYIITFDSFQLLNTDFKLEIY